MSSERRKEKEPLHEEIHGIRIQNRASQGRNVAEKPFYDRDWRYEKTGKYFQKALFCYVEMKFIIIQVECYSPIHIHIY